MCGIFGFAGVEGTGSALEKMGDALIHRGPDSAGYMRKPKVSMGARRLSIIDIEGGDQPASNEDGSVIVCQNGEIYNHVELREELVALGHRFSSRSDTEVLAHAYEEWGDDFVSRLNGMYAFAVWDERRRRLFIARDRCGQKPLYYWTDGRRLVFASEVKALFCCPDVPREPCRRAIDAYLTLRYVPEPTTMFNDIVTLPAAHQMVWQEGAGGRNMGHPVRYWNVPVADDPPRSHPEEGLGDLLDDAVRIALRSDVEVGAYLSGGIDSSLLVASMRQVQEKVHTFSIGFGAPTDETALAAETARLLGTKHHEIICTPNDLVETLPKVVWHMDRPVGDALTVAFYRLAQEARREVKVVLSGEGADELYAGYPFHRTILAIESLRRRFPAWFVHTAIPRILETIPLFVLDRMSGFPSSLGASGRARVARYFRDYPTMDLWQRSIGLRTLFDRGERQRLYGQGNSFGKAHMLEPFGIPEIEEPPHPELLDRLLALLWQEWLQDWAIIRQDKNSMAHGLEIRLPFLDHRLIEHAFQILPGRKMAGKRDKIVLRELAAERLPRTTAARAKIPFHLPIEYFCANPALRKMIGENLSAERVKERGYFDPGVVEELVRRMDGRDFVAVKKVMALVILELWHRIFIDGESL